MVSTTSIAGQKRSHDGKVKEPSKNEPLQTHTAETPAKSQDDQMFTLIIGADEEHTQVKVKHMARAGEFFKAALKLCWREGQERLMRLPDEEPNLMSHYLYFLRKGKLDDAELEMDASKERRRMMFAKLANMYVLGERMLDKNFQNVVFDALFAALGMRGCRQQVPLFVATIIYDGTPARSPARILMAECFASHSINPAHEARFREESDPDFIKDLEAIHRAPFHNICKRMMAYYTTRKASDYHKYARFPLDDLRLVDMSSPWIHQVGKGTVR